MITTRPRISSREHLHASARDTVRWLYSLIVYLCLPFLWCALYWHYRASGDYNARWRERLGWVTPMPAAINTPVIWVHLASVGEVLAARELLEQLMKRYPEKAIVVTTTTPTGAERVVDLFDNNLQHYYLPYDTPGCMQRFLQRIAPELLIILETELWPNMIASCAKHHIPIVLANGRMSARSRRGYQRFRWLSAPLFNRLALVAAQSEADHTRFQQLGATHTITTGNIKYDLEIPTAQLEQAQALKQQWTRNYQRLVWIAASTHNGEEALILEVFSYLKHYVDDLLLVIVPRHRERFDTVAKLCINSGYQIQHRSYGEPVSVTTDIVLGDTMGELMLLYGASDIAFVGGSLIDNGGHNMLEPAAWGLPVFSGASIYNFTDVAAGLLDVGGLAVVNNSDELGKSIQQLLRDPQKLQHQGQMARRYLDANKGALERLLTQLSHYLDQ